MKRICRKTLAAVLTAVLLLTAVPFAAAAETTKQSLTVIADSNFFPKTGSYFADLSQYEDANGDVFVSVEYKLKADAQYLINLDVDELCWDPSVLEFKEAYNKYGSGRRQIFTVLPFAYEQGMGAGMVNTFDDSNSGRIIANHTSVSPAAYAYEEDGSAVVFLRARFKVIDRETAVTTVSLMMDTISLCDEAKTQPFSQNTPILGCEIDKNAYALGTYSSCVAESSDTFVVGDLDNDGVLSISDATALQRIVAEFGAIDAGDEKAVCKADFNGDGKTNVKDITAIQRRLAAF